MNCANFKEHIVDYLFGELSQEVASEFERHVSSCENCRQSLREFEETFALISSEEVPELDAAFWARFDEELYKKVDLNGLERKVLGFPFKRVLAYAASLLIALSAGFYMKNYFDTHGTETIAKKIVVEKSGGQPAEKIQKETQVKDHLDLDDEKYYYSAVEGLIAMSIGDETDSIEEVIDPISIFTHIDDPSDSNTGLVYDIDSGYLLSELFTVADGDLADSLAFSDGVVSQFLDPETLVDEFYNEYINLSEDEQKIIESAFKNIIG